MKLLYAVLLCAYLAVARSLEDLSFPPGFKFGVSSSAYQVEGGWNSSDKSVNIWDEFTQSHPELIGDRTTGNVACDSYHLWKRDVEILDELGVDLYRFSLSWARLLPKGFDTHISQDGAKYYNDLIDALLEKGIEPVVTIYHWDLPMTLQKHGGWTNPLISDWFAAYARTVFTLYGDRVKTWLTINEPSGMCELAYNGGYLAPGILDTEVAPYLCNKHVTIAHAKAYRIYDQEFRQKYAGRVSISSVFHWYEPFSEKDVELAELTRLNMARTCHPIFSKEGGWPPQIEKVLEENHRKLGYPQSNLPKFTKEETEFVRGTYDFFALNFYTSRLIRPARPGEQLSVWHIADCPDLNAKVEYDNSWKRGESDWLYINPQGIRRIMIWLRKHYGDLEILITENGYSGVHEQERINYYMEHLKQVLLAIKEDGVNVIGYTIWSLMDNFEWMDGYETKFGLYEVDFTSPLRMRTPRPAARYYADVIANRTLDIPHVGYVTVASLASKSVENSEDHKTASEESWQCYRGQWIAVSALILAVLAAVALIFGYPAWRARKRDIPRTIQQIYASVKTS